MTTTTSGQPGALIDTTVESNGRGGKLTITASDAITISGSDSLIFSAAFDRGKGGEIFLTAPRIALTDGAVGAFADGQGIAGDIFIQAGETFRSQNGTVTTAAEQAGGGRIELRAGHLVQLQDSEVTTSVRGGGGDAGNLTLTSPFVVADGSAMVANAFGGVGGNILIDAGVFLRDPASLVSASSALGIQGTVNIQAPVTSLSGTVAPLSQAFVHVATLLPARCAARLSEGKASSLVLGGREGLPLEPGGLLPSPLVLEERLAADPAMRGAPAQQTSAAKFALLAAHEKGLPRLGCPP
jgi:hypothetical protein